MKLRLRRSGTPKMAGTCPELVRLASGLINSWACTVRVLAILILPPLSLVVTASILRVNIDLGFVSVSTYEEGSVLSS